MTPNGHLSIHVGFQYHPDGLPPIEAHSLPEIQLKPGLDCVQVLFAVEEYILKNFTDEVDATSCNIPYAGE